MDIIIARYIGETTLNGIEFLLDDEGNPFEFESVTAAKEFLRSSGINLTDDQMEDSFMFIEASDIEPINDFEED